MKLLQELVRIQSYSGQEKKLASFIMAYCQKRSIPARFQAENVVIYLPGRDKTKALFFNSHLDTVGAGNISCWKYPPFGKKAGQIKRGKLYGLGASDDKSAIAAMLTLAKYYSTNRKPPFDLWFLFVVKEETDGSGSASFLSWFARTKYFKRYKNMSAIIGESTGLKTLEIGHRGNIFVKLQTSGVSGHAAKMVLKKDMAAEKMLISLVKLKNAFQSWKKEYFDKTLGVPTINITSITTAKTSVNKIPAFCEAVLDVRTTFQFHKRVTMLLSRLSKDMKVDVLAEAKPSLTPADSLIIKAFQKAIPELSFTISLGTTDVGLFNEKGINAIVFGPGEKKTIHRENEYVYLSKVEKCVRIYKKVIETY